MITERYNHTMAALPMSLYRSWVRSPTASMFTCVRPSSRSQRMHEALHVHSAGFLLTYIASDFKDQACRLVICEMGSGVKVTKLIWFCK